MTWISKKIYVSRNRQTKLIQIILSSDFDFEKHDVKKWWETKTSTWCILFYLPSREQESQISAYSNYKHVERSHLVAM